MSQPTPAQLRQTPLHDVHVQAGATFTDFGGWNMPLRYRSDLLEHQAVRNSAGIFDLSHMGEIKVSGRQAGAALDYALTGEISKIALGRARYTMMVDTDGGVIDDLIVYHMGAQDYLVVPNAGNRQQVLAQLLHRCTGTETGTGAAKHFDCTVEDLSLQTALIAVQGPRAEEILRGVITSGSHITAALRPDPHEEDSSAALPGAELLKRLRYYAAVPAKAAGTQILLARTGYTGEDGFELFCSANAAEALWTAITTYAQTLSAPPAASTTPALPALTPCGLAARDSLRLEAGMPLYGHELSQNITPFDANLGSVVKFDKPDFVGRKALEVRAQNEGGAGTKVLVALTGQGRRAARAGCSVYDAQQQLLGVITSGLLSPTLGYPIALALLAPASAQQPAWAVGQELSVDVRGKYMSMRVVAPPFYKRAR